MSHHGQIAYPSILAFDTIRKIIAVGGHTDSFVKVFGGPTLETILVLKPGSGRILHLCFLQNVVLFSSPRSSCSGQLNCRQRTASPDLGD
jgi:hypothetical protein